MTVVEINSFSIGSTGRIMCQISKNLTDNGNTCIACVPKSRSNLRKTKQKTLFIGNRLSRNTHILLGYITGLNGCFSVLSTIVFIRRLKTINPDVVHLHNLHNCYVNIPLLLRYLKKDKKRVVWTMHDCWAFTGHCPHFEMVECQKWKNGCHECPLYKEYPASLYDNASWMYSKKKRWFSDVDQLTIVVPSQWLKQTIMKSFLKKYEVVVINNGIDLEIFKPRESRFRIDYGLEAKKVVLAVITDFSKRKGYDIVLRIADLLDESYKVVIVGAIERNSTSTSNKIIMIPRTNNEIELAEYYSAADVFINPTREDTFPTVNIEALACGTPVVTFNSGGSPEILDCNSGIVIEKEDVNGFVKAIEKVCFEKTKNIEHCINRAKQFNNNEMSRKYIELLCN